MAQRRFDADGMEWVVYDVVAAGDLRRNFQPWQLERSPDPPGAVFTTWLCFEMVGVDAQKRRLSPIPQEWPELSEEQLCDLLALAQPAMK